MHVFLKSSFLAFKLENIKLQKKGESNTTLNGLLLKEIGKTGVPQAVRRHRVQDMVETKRVIVLKCSEPDPGREYCVNVRHNEVLE